MPNVRPLIALRGWRIVMATLGPVVVVAERRPADLVEALVEDLGNAGAFPIIETGFADAAAAIEQIQPAALILTDAEPWPVGPAGASFRKAVETGSGPFIPVLARVGQDRQLAAGHVFPIHVFPIHVFPI